MNPLSLIAGIKNYLWGALVLALVAFGASQYVGKTQVTAELSAYRLEVAKATANQEADVRTREHELAQANEKLANDLDQKNRRLAVADAAARRADAGLRDAIAKLNARTTPTNPESAALADEARTARELLGACADEYRSVALEADGLRDQVSGLQTYIHNVVQPGE